MSSAEPDWRAEYLSNFQAAQPSSKNIDSQALLDICAQLTDKIMELHAENALLASRAPPPSATTTTTGAPETTTTTTSADDKPALARALADTAESIRSRDKMQARMTTAENELSRLRAREAANSKTLREYADSRILMTRRLRDQESELAEKGKLLSEVQNEMLAITIELTQRENEVKKYKKEVESLTRQILAVKQHEVEALNRANERRPA